MNNAEVHDKIIMLEEKLNHFEKEINELKNTTRDLSQALEKLTTTLLAIKNWVVGAILFGVANEVGLMSVLKMILI